ncbi:hypothetical protein [Mycolicibacterium hippocampi]|uniref:Uncharacterized protein n=1 Tax=Mycolicibacterium hippocampi TaxID=659824 RepID=A0A7I9ZKI0_9MYCO|nr:hypothetical protein [Mycolicibacterium hippocampi]GFH01532.1 hypothetical protein MHIP_20150 [Mycolicibacterium hippocampi]
MKIITLAGTAGVAAALSAVIVGSAAPAAAAPGGAGNAMQVIDMLEADGNYVIVNRVSTVPVAEADVVAVRPGPQMQQVVLQMGRQGDNRNNTDRVVETTGRFYFVDIG